MKDACIKCAMRRRCKAVCLPCRELDDLHSGAIRKGALPDSRPEGDASPKDGDLVGQTLIEPAVRVPPRG